MRPIARPAPLLWATIMAAALGCDDTETGAPLLAPVYDVAFGPGATPDGGGDALDDTGVDTTVDSTLDLPDLEPGPTPDGESCLETADCQSLSCLLPEDGFPEGMCSPAPCGAEVPCSGADTLCYQPPSGGAFCSRRCTGGSDCRSGYDCEFIEDLGFGACAPAPPPEDLPDGEACSGDEQCLGGTCLPSPEWPGGHCTTLGCESDEDCAAGPGDVSPPLCQPSQTGGPSTCLRTCQSAADCRGRYVCQPVTDELGFCAPDPNQPVDIDTDASPLGFSCDVDAVGFTTLRLSYAIDEATTSYMVVPVALDGRRLVPVRVRRPEPAPEIDFFGDNFGQLATAQILGFVSPMSIPWVPTLSDQLSAGNHDMDVETSSQALCYYVLQETSAGTTIDLNLYLVGVAGLDAETAPGDLNLAAALDTVDAVFATAGFAIGEVRYFDVSDSLAEQFAIMRSEGDVTQLVATSQPPGESLDEQLSANVFLTQAFAMGGAIGISSGLPGPAGLHGTAGSGVVLSSEVLGAGDEGNALTGQIMAHELGHFLGLWHTTELSGLGADPLDDTPVCTTDSLETCPDFNNLMFPVAGTGHVELSAGQSFMLQNNPLTKD